MIRLELACKIFEPPPPTIFGERGNFYGPSKITSFVPINMPRNAGIYIYFFKL